MAKRIKSLKEWDMSEHFPFNDIIKGFVFCGGSIKSYKGFFDISSEITKLIKFEIY
jgi:hypothetical protein